MYEKPTYQKLKNLGYATLIGTTLISTQPYLQSNLYAQSQTSQNAPASNEKQKTTSEKVTEMAGKGITSIVKESKLMQEVKSGLGKEIEGTVQGIMNAIAYALSTGVEAAIRIVDGVIKGVQTTDTYQGGKEALNKIKTTVEGRFNGTYQLNKNEQLLKSYDSRIQTLEDELLRLRGHNIQRIESINQHVQPASSGSDKVKRKSKRVS